MINVQIPYPMASMYGIFTYIYHKNQPNVGKYNIPYIYHTWILWVPYFDFKLIIVKKHIWSQFRIA